MGKNRQASDSKSSVARAGKNTDKGKLVVPLTLIGVTPSCAHTLIAYASPTITCPHTDAVT
eukprot:6491479-Amphidinium_carterae.1